MATQYKLTINGNKVMLTIPKIIDSDPCDEATAVFYFSSSKGIESAMKEAALYAAADYHDYFEGKEDKKE